MQNKKDQQRIPTGYPTLTKRTWHRGGNDERHRAGRFLQAGRHGLPDWKGLPTALKTPLNLNLNRDYTGIYSCKFAHAVHLSTDFIYFQVQCKKMKWSTFKIMLRNQMDNLRKQPSRNVCLISSEVIPIPTSDATNDNIHISECRKV